MYARQPLRSESLLRGAGCVNCARPDLWGARERNLPGLPDLHEAAEHQEDGLRRAVTGHGIPREYYVDLGAAYIAHSLRTICAELGIHLLHAGPGQQ